MRRPFVISVEDDDDARAAAIAHALAAPLRARDATARVVTGARGRDGSAVSIGVADDAVGPRWLAPLDVSVDPDHAAGEVITFLERWGFVRGPRASSARRA
jgi:hypothetical protein